MIQRIPKLKVRRDSGGAYLYRRRLNVISGAGIAVSLVDDPAVDEIRLGITALSGAGPFVKTDGTTPLTNHWIIGNHQLRVGNGTSALPSLAWVDNGGHWDGGFFRIAEDRIGIAFSGVSRWELANTFIGDGSGALSPRMYRSVASSTVPSFRPNGGGDINTGIGWNGPDSMSFIAGGVNVMNILGSGRMGIGTLIPNEALEVAGKIRALTAFNLNGTDGLTGTYNFGGGGSGDIASLTFAGGILTAITTVP